MKHMYFLHFLGLLLICACADSNPVPNDDNDVDTPTVKPSFSVSTIHISADLTIDVYVPTVAHPTNAYPIIYFNDGDSFLGSIGMLASRKFEGEGAVEPFMIVGIHAGRNRLNWYTPYDDPWIEDNWDSYSAQALHYTDRLITEVIPAVESQHGVDAKRRAIFGFSLGGLHAAWATINYPEVFSFCSAMSPSFWVADYAIFGEPDETIDSKFYFDIGTKEWNYYVPMIASLESAGLEYGKNIFYYEVPNGVHTEADWSARLAIPLGLFLNGAPQEVKQIDIVKECIPSQRTAGLVFQRLNPIITFTNGIRYSLSTSASFSVLEGQGEVLEDGQFSVESGAITVEVSHADWSETLTVTNCN